MKKKILFLSILAVFSFTACSSNTNGTNSNKNTTPINTNSKQPTTSDSVDSVTFDLAKNSKKETITISKDDDYDTVIEKLGVPYLHSKNEKISINAKVQNEITADKYYDYEYNKNKDSYDINQNKMTIYNNYHKTEIKNCNDSFYIYNDGSEVLYTENIIINNTLSANSNTLGNINYENVNKICDDKKIYYKTTGNIKSEGYMEVAGKDVYHHDTIYANLNWNNRSEYQQAMAGYTMDGYDYNFSNIFSNIKSNPNIYSLSYGNAGQGVSADLNSVKYEVEAVKQYIDASFKLTDKYIILNYRLNMPYEVYILILTDPDFINKHPNYLKRFEGSYSDTQIWIDYKDIKVVENEYGMSVNENLGYSYFKFDLVYKYNADMTFSKEYNSDIENYIILPYEYVNDLNELDGQTSNINKNSTMNVEIKLLDTTDEEINNIKNEIINYCKNNNQLNKK